MFALGYRRLEGRDYAVDTLREAETEREAEGDRGGLNFTDD